jgi:hypothetical protein
MLAQPCVIFQMPKTIPTKSSIPPAPKPAPFSIPAVCAADFHCHQERTGEGCISLEFCLVVGRQRHSPNVSWFIQLDTAVQWFVWIDIDNPSRCTLIRHVDVNRDFHSPTQFNGGGDQGTMKADDDGFAIARLTLSASLNRDYHLQRNTSAASAPSGTSGFMKQRHTQEGYWTRKC